jgi:hypothetical protein
MAAPDELNAGVDLPPSGMVRWSPHRKALVVNAVRNGSISLDEACRRYQLSAGEFLAWQEALETYGIGALRVTCVQLYRDAPATLANAVTARV